MIVIAVVIAVIVVIVIVWSTATNAPAGDERSETPPPETGRHGRPSRTARKKEAGCGTICAGPDSGLQCRDGRPSRRRQDVAARLDVPRAEDRRRALLFPDSSA